MGDIYAAPGKQILDIAIAQREPEVEPDSVLMARPYSAMAMTATGLT